MEDGREVHAADEARLEHETRTRRMRLPGGQRAGPHADRRKTPRSLSGALPPTGNKVEPYPVEGNQNTEQTIPAPDRPHRETKTDKETKTGKTAVAPGNARSHHTRAPTALYEPGQPLKRITPVLLPPYAPGHNPVDHVRDTTTNIQRETPDQTFSASAPYITGRALDHDPEHSHPAKPKTTLLHDSHRSYAHSIYS